MKELNLDEFRNIYLQEVNRRFFHPLGLAMYVNIEDGKVTGIGGIYDEREDQDKLGFVFNKIDFDKVNNIDEEFNKFAENRIEQLGSVIQHKDFI